MPFRRCRRTGDLRAPGPLRRLTLTLALVMVCTAALPAGAHQLKVALTSVALNARSGEVEVIHRFYVHDAEQAVHLLGGMQGDIQRDADLRNAFARYVGRHFVLADESGTPLPLTLVGAEIDGEFLWIYQTLPGDLWPRIALAGDSALQGLWPEQVNRINIRRDGRVHTLVCNAGDGLKPVVEPDGD